MSGSYPTIPLLELELVTSGHRVVISLQQILIYAIVSVHKCTYLYLYFVYLYHVTLSSSLFIREYPEIWYQLGGMPLHPLNKSSVLDQSWCPGNITELSVRPVECCEQVRHGITVGELI